MAHDRWADESLKFFDLAVASGLLEKDELRRLRLDFRRSEPERADDAGAFADYLVAAGKLTRWQCDKLLDGKYKGFYFDAAYRLIDYLGDTLGRQHYVAEEVATGRRVVVRIAKGEGPGVEYERIGYLEDR